MGSPGNDTELTVRVYNEITNSALILRQSMLLDGCVFACEKSAIMSARAPPCRILKLAPISKSRYGGKHNEKVIDRDNHEKRRKKNYHR